MHYSWSRNVIDCYTEALQVPVNRTVPIHIFMCVIGEIVQKPYRVRVIFIIRRIIAKIKRIVVTIFNKYIVTRALGYYVVIETRFYIDYRLIE